MLAATFNFVNTLSAMFKFEINDNCAKSVECTNDPNFSKLKWMLFLIICVMMWIWYDALLNLQLKTWQTGCQFTLAHKQKRTKMFEIKMKRKKLK